MPSLAANPRRAQFHESGPDLAASVSIFTQQNQSQRAVEGYPAEDFSQIAAGIQEIAALEDCTSPRKDSGHIRSQSTSYAYQQSGATDRAYGTIQPAKHKVANLQTLQI